MEPHPAISPARPGPRPPTPPGRHPDGTGQRRPSPIGDTNSCADPNRTTPALRSTLTSWNPAPPTRPRSASSLPNPNGARMSAPAAGPMCRSSASAKTANPGLWSIDRELLFDHPDRAAHVRRWSKLRVWLFLDGKARCSVPREDCGPRREGAAAPPVGQGASSQEVAAAAAPSPLPGWTPARRSHHVAWHATFAASHRWRGGSPCQPSLVAAPHVWLPLS